MAKMAIALSKSSWNAYCRALHESPIVTKSLTAAAGFALGDVVAQMSTRQPGQRYNYARTARMTAFGLGFAGPLQGHYWYTWLDKVVMPARATSPAAVLAKIGIDQTVMAPIGTAAFFAALNLMEGVPEHILPSLKEKLLPTVIAGWKLWVPAHAINFGFVPSSQRVLYVNTVAIAWTYILSTAAAGKQQQQQPKGAGVDKNEPVPVQVPE